MTVTAGCMLAVGAVILWSSRSEGPLEPPAETGDGVAATPVTRGTSGDLFTVRGNPGWESLSEQDQARAHTPLSPEARDWLREERLAVRRIAAAFDVSPVALGGIVAAEKTLLVGRADALGEELFRAVFGSLRDTDLEYWVAEQERGFQRTARPDASPDAWSPVRAPYLWTLGPAQVSFRLAIRSEPAVARRLDRPQRGAAEVLDAVTSMPGNLEYAAALVAEAQRAYHDLAAADISANPGVLATLYHLGAPTVRARRLSAENAARRSRGDPAEPPHVNYYGAFVNHHAGEIAVLLGVAGAAGARPR